MTPDEVRQVQKSFADLAPSAEQFVERFYHGLFALDWSLKPLFKGDPPVQMHKLMRRRTLVINDLDPIGNVPPALQNLGRRHVVYGVRPHHYDIVGTALLGTLERCLGPGFTPDVRTAWTAMVEFVIGTMDEAAHAGTAASSVTV